MFGCEVGSIVTSVNVDYNAIEYSFFFFVAQKCNSKINIAHFTNMYISLNANEKKRKKASRMIKIACDSRFSRPKKYKCDDCAGRRGNDARGKKMGKRE